MHGRLLTIVATALGTGVLVSQALAYGSGSAGPCASGNLAKTSSYILALSIGHAEEMWLPSEVKARHIKTGEVMLGGEMAMIDSRTARWGRRSTTSRFTSARKTARLRRSSSPTSRLWDRAWAR